MPDEALPYGDSESQPGLTGRKGGGNRLPKGVFVKTLHEICLWKEVKNDH